MALHVHQALWPQIEAEPGLRRRLPAHRDADLGACSARIERTGVLIDCGAARGAEPASSPSACWRSSSEALRARRPAVQPRQPEADRRDPVRQARPAGRQQDRERRAVDRRGSAAGARRGLPAAGKLLEHRSLSKLKGTYTDKLPLMVNPATGRVHTTLCAGGGGDRAAVEQRPEPAEHPDPHAPRAGASARRSSRRAGAVILSADYSQIELRIMAHISRRRRPAARLRRRHRRAPRDRGRGVRRRAGPRSSQRAAALRQGDQLRPDLRHERVRPGRQPRHRAQRRDRLHRALFRALSRRQALHGRDARVGASSSGYVETVFGRRVYLPEINAAAGRAAGAAERAGDQRADAGHRGRPDQAGDDRGAGRARPRGSGRRG